MTESARASAIISDDLWWNGPNATAANGGSQVRIYAPTTYAGGSSVSHVDQATYQGQAVMTPYLSNGTALHEPNAFELGMMQDMGWGLWEGGAGAIAGGGEPSGGGGLLVAGDPVLISATLEPAFYRSVSVPALVELVPAGSQLPTPRVTVGPVRLAGQTADRLFAGLDEHPRESVTRQFTSPIKQLPAELGSLSSPLLAPWADLSVARGAAGQAADGWFAGLARQPLNSSLSDWDGPSGREEPSQGTEQRPGADDESWTTALPVWRADDQRLGTALFEDDSRWSEEAAVLDELFAEFDQQPGEDGSA